MVARWLSMLIKKVILIKLVDDASTNLKSYLPLNFQIYLRTTTYLKNSISKRSHAINEKCFPRLFILFVFVS